MIKKYFKRWKLFKDLFLVCRWAVRLAEVREDGVYIPTEIFALIVFYTKELEKY